MALDPRIALQGIQWQAPDILGAVRQGQDIRKNNMAMRAEAAAAERNAMVRGRGMKVDYTDPRSVNKFVQFAGADAMPYLEAASAGVGLGAAQGAERRAQGTFNRDERDANSDFIVNGLGAVYNDPSDANIANISARAIAMGIPEEQMTAYSSRLLAVPEGERRAVLANELATTPEGLKLLERFAPDYDYQNAGGSLVPVQTNPLVPGAAPPQPITVTPSPNRPQYQIVQGADGGFQVIELGTGSATDTGVVGRVPGSGAAGQDPDRAAGAAAGLRDTIDSLRGYYTDLDEARGIVSTERGPMDNLVASAGASLPGRVLGRTFGSREQTLRDNIRTAIPMVVASLKDLTGMSAQQMNSNVELQLFLGTVGDPSQSIETVMEALDRFERYVDAVAEGRASAAPAADPMEGRTATGPGGQRVVRRNGQWVPAR